MSGMSNALLRRACKGLWVQCGFKLSEINENERFSAILLYGADVDLEALDRFLAKPDYWEAKEVLRAKRCELLRLRKDAVVAYEAGNLDLAAMTARLMSCEAKFIGMRVAADKRMRTRKFIDERNASLAPNPDEMTRLKTAWRKYWERRGQGRTVNNACEVIAEGEIKEKFSRNNSNHVKARNRIARLVKKHPTTFPTLAIRAKQRAGD